MNLSYNRPGKLFRISMQVYEGPEILRSCSAIRGQPDHLPGGLSRGRSLRGWVLACAKWAGPQVSTQILPSFLSMSKN